MKLPSRSEINSVFASFSKKEWVIFGVLAAALLFSTLAILQSINKSFMVSVPAEGGVIREGIVGTPRFVNPALATSPADRDLVALVYSGLLRESEEELVPDLAESYEVSEGDLAYTFILKNNIYFHDGTPITADDVIFTVNKVRDPVIKSPRGGNWDGAVAEKIDERTIKFTLRQPYASFLQDSTLGILPEHIWGEAPIELNTANTDPVGSGPFRVSKVSKQSSGVIDSYELTSFKKFSLGKPYVKKIILRFYPNENELVRALQGGEVDQAGSLTPMVAETLKGKNYRIESSVLPRIFGLFFNQNESQLFIDKNILRAIDLAIDKERIIRNVFLGYGVPIDGPIPLNLLPEKNSKTEDVSTQAERQVRAQELLAKAGWKKNAEGFLEKTTTEKKKKVTTELAFSISTGNAPELAQAAELIQEDLAAIGMKVEVKTFEVGNLNQAVIRPRKYDALLFGEVISQITDLSAFWHSSQRKDPGLNVAMYTNAKVDKILEDASTLADDEARAKKYSQFEEEIKKDMPAVFLYSPKFIYAVSPDLGGLAIGEVTSPEDRFLGSYLWFTATDNIWKIFKK